MDFDPQRYGTGEVTGDSMLPVLRRGDVVVFDRQAGELRVGMIVAFRGVVHRVLWCDPWGGIWHAGEQAGYAVRVASGEVLGPVVGITRDGDFVEFPTTWAGEHTRWQRLLRGFWMRWGLSRPR